MTGYWKRMFAVVLMASAMGCLGGCDRLGEIIDVGRDAVCECDQISELQEMIGQIEDLFDDL